MYYEWQEPTKNQWERAYDVPLTRPHQLAFYESSIKGDSSYQYAYKSWPIWASNGLFLRAMSLQLIYSWWTFHLHAFLPAFPATSVEIRATLSPQEWRDETDIPEKIRIDDLAKKCLELFRLRLLYQDLTNGPMKPRSKSE